MSTPYRIEYNTGKRKISIAGGSDGYPRDIIQGEILIDLPTIKTNPKEYIADIALEGEDYYGRRLDSYGNCPAEFEYQVDIKPDDTFVTVSGYDCKRATVSLNALEQMTEFDADEFYEGLTHGFDHFDQSGIEYYTEMGHTIFVDNIETV
jgi:hypothetical protein